MRNDFASDTLEMDKVLFFLSDQYVKTAVCELRLFEEESDGYPSVIMFGLDSMSRSNFIRTLPKFHERLKSIGFTDMTGHVKIADNTFQNWAAILTGKRASSTRVIYYWLF